VIFRGCKNTVINNNTIDDSDSNDDVNNPAVSGIEEIDNALMITFVSGI
jgi:polygalacturonase